MAKAQGKKFSFGRDVLGGQFLSVDGKSGNPIFIIYVFVLVLLYITVSLSVERTQRLKGHNKTELKNLKADYTSKAARLQNQSSRDQIKRRLVENGSTLKSPTAPARRVKRSAQKDLAE